MERIAQFLTGTHINIPVTLFRLFLGFLLGGLIGLEREWHRQSAGLRTHIIICTGSCLLTLLSIYIPQTYTHFRNGDPGRIAAQIVSGIGFLGGGAILRYGVNIRGLTTAASIWVVAGIGMTAGAGMYAAAFIGTGFILFTLFVMAPFEKRLFPGMSLRRLIVAMEGKNPDTEGVLPILKAEGIDVKSMDISQSFIKKTLHLRFVVHIPQDLGWTELYRKLGKLSGVSQVSLDQKL